MIGQIFRIQSFKQSSKTESEVRLNDLKDTVKAWETSGLGIDEHPARAGTRLETDQPQLVVPQVKLEYLPWV